jgi:hypothetical protein
MQIKSLLFLIFIFMSNPPLFAGNTVPETDTNIVIKVTHGQLKIHKTNTPSSLLTVIGHVYTEQDVSDEAEQKNIFEDQVILELKYDENCKLTSIIVNKKGQLERFNAVAELFGQQLLEDLKQKKLTGIFTNRDGKCDFRFIPLHLKML